MGREKISQAETGGEARRGWEGHTGENNSLPAPDKLLPHSSAVPGRTQPSVLHYTSHTCRGRFLQLTGFLGIQFRDHLPEAWGPLHRLP